MRPCSTTASARGSPSFRGSRSPAGGSPDRGAHWGRPPRGCTPRCRGSRCPEGGPPHQAVRDRKSTRLSSSHSQISYAVFCLKKKKIHTEKHRRAAASIARGLALAAGALTAVPDLFHVLGRSRASDRVLVFAAGDLAGM